MCLKFFFDQILEASSGEVVVLHSSHLTSFKTSEDPDGLAVPFCRSLSSAAWEGPRMATPLERPNVVNGLAAAGKWSIHMSIFLQGVTVVVFFLFHSADAIRVLWARRRSSADLLRLPGPGLALALRLLPAPPAADASAEEGGHPEAGR